MSLVERRDDVHPTVSLQALLAGACEPLKGSSTLTVTDYTEEIVASGLPGIRGVGERSRAVQLDRYLEPVPCWLPTWNHSVRLAQSPKHQLADPAFAAHLLGATVSGLLSNQVGAVGRSSGASHQLVRDGLLLGALFESFVTQSVRSYA